MATIKNKTKKKTAQDWEKELKKLLKGETVNTLKSAHISKLRAIRSAYYHIPASSRKNLSNRITSLSKQAEAIRKGTERAASNQVKKTKYKEAPQTKQRQESKQTSDLRTKLGLPHVPEPPTTSSGPTGVFKEPTLKQPTKTPDIFTGTTEEDIKDMMGASNDIFGKVPEGFDVLIGFIDNLQNDRDKFAEELLSKTLTERLRDLREQAELKGYTIQLLELSDPKQIANQIGIFYDEQISKREEKEWKYWATNFYNSGYRDKVDKWIGDLLEDYQQAENQAQRLQMRLSRVSTNLMDLVKGDINKADAKELNNKYRAVAKQKAIIEQNIETLQNKMQNIYSLLYNIYEALVLIRSFEQIANSDDLKAISSDIGTIVGGEDTKLNYKQLTEVYTEEELISAPALALFDE